MTKVPDSDHVTEAVVGAVGVLLLKCEQVAALLQVSHHTVTNLHRTSQLKGVRCGKHLRWKLSDVRRYVDELGDDE